MAEQYCSTCRGPLNSLVEMSVVYIGLINTLYQCPCCMATRRVGFIGIATPESTKTTSTDTKESSTGGGVVRTAVALALLAALVGRGK